MNHKQREKTAQQGIEFLNNSIFPNKLLQPIKDKRLRTELSNSIFYPKNSPKHNELSPQEKQQRSERLKVELAFISKMSSLDAFRKSALILIISGL